MKIFQKIKTLDFFESFKHGSIYFLSFLFVQLISFVSLPIITKYLSPADYGITEVFLQTSRVLGILFSLNLYAGLMRFIFEPDMDKKELTQFTFTSICISFFFFALLFLVFRQYLFNALNLPVALFYPLLVYILFNNILGAFFIAITNASNKSVLYAVWNVTINLVKVVLILLFLVYWQPNYQGRIYAEVIATTFIIALSLLIFYPYVFKLRFKVSYRNELLSYSTGLIPIAISGFLLTYLDTLVINKVKGSSDAGLYSYAYKISIIYTGISNSFYMSVRPKFYNLVNMSSFSELYKEQHSYIKLITFFITGFLFFSKDLGKLLATNALFQTGLFILPIILLGNYLNDLTELYNFYINYEKKNRLFVFTFIITTIINFILNVIFVPKYGFVASAYITLLSYVILFVATYFIVQKYIRMQSLSVKTPLTFLFIALSVALLLYGLEQLNMSYIPNLLLRILVFMLLSLYFWKNILNKFFINKNR